MKGTLVLGSVLTVAVCAGAARAQGPLTWMGVLPGGGHGVPVALTPDGSAAAGTWTTVQGARSAFRWTAAGMQALPSTLGGDAEAFGISADGLTVVGYARLSLSLQHAAAWNASGAMTDLGALSSLNWGADARAIASDGSIFGTTYTTQGNRAYRWTAATGMVTYPLLPGFDSAGGFRASADGAVVVGVCENTVANLRHATIWVNGVPQDLGTLPGDPASAAMFVSPDGSVVVGESGAVVGNAGAPGRRAFRWTAAEGMRALFDIPVNSIATGVSADASLIVGGWIWTPAQGLRDTVQVLADYGISVPSGIAYAAAVTPDGRRLAGIGSNAGQSQGWVATLPPGLGCYANCDGSTASPILNVADFTCFLNRFAAGDSYANCDNSTTPPTLNIADFVCFLNRFAVGCP